MEGQDLKARVNLTIDSSIVSECKHLGMNMSAMCEDFLRSVLLTFERGIDPELCKHRWTFPFTTSFGLAKECLKCRSIKRVVMDSDPEVWVNEPKL